MNQQIDNFHASSQRFQDKTTRELVALRDELDEQHRGLMKRMKDLADRMSGCSLVLQEAGLGKGDLCGLENKLRELLVEHNELGWRALSVSCESMCLMRELMTRREDHPILV